MCMKVAPNCFGGPSRHRYSSESETVFTAGHRNEIINSQIRTEAPQIDDKIVNYNEEHVSENKISKRITENLNRAKNYLNRSEYHNENEYRAHASMNQQIPNAYPTMQYITSTDSGMNSIR